MSKERLEIIAVKNIGDVHKGIDLAQLIAQQAKLKDFDCVVITQKIVSKAEGAIVKLDGDIEKAKQILVEQNSKRILRRRGNLIISENLQGFICANAGVDLSNVPKGYAAVLPRYPDKSAARIRSKLLAITNLKNLAVIITDTFGRPFRRGLVNVAIGLSGLKTIADYKGEHDPFGNELKVTEIAIADEIASAAELVMGKTKGIPVVIVRGIEHRFFGRGSAKELIRDFNEDLFR